MDTILIYTDGSSGNRTGKDGGIGVVIVHGDDRYEFAQGYANTSNNRMELRAAIAGFDLVRHTHYRVKLISDSEYVVNPFKKGWVYQWERDGFADRKNADLWRLLLAQVRRFKHVEFIWVRGHVGHVHNERCDYLANQAKRNPKKLPCQ